MINCAYPSWGRAQTIKSTKIRRIEKVLQTLLDGYRKFVVWCILAPYVINIRKNTPEETFGTIKNWLDKCSQLREVDFSPNYLVKYNINSAERNGYLPISLEKLKKIHTCTMC